MAGIAVVHMDLMSKGGGEAVCMNVLEALEDRHDVTVITLTDPDLEELNGYFNTDVTDVSVDVASVGGSFHRWFGLDHYVLQNALLRRYACSRAGQFDLLLSTINELGLPNGSIEYVHFPFDWTVNLNSKLRSNIFHPTIEDDGVYERLCTHVAGITRRDVQGSTLLANSRWTAAAVEQAYGVRPDVLAPPIDVGEFLDRPARDRNREAGFVTIGRVERSKRLHELIEIVDGVRDRGHDVHLHILGPTVDEEYGTQIASMASTRPYVDFEGEVSRETLVERARTHRFGIHGKRHEHFGMAVAELVAAGAITFVPDGGGQSEIIDGEPLLVYESREDAVEKISHVLSNPDLHDRLSVDPETVRERYGRERFQRRVAAIVRERLGLARPVATSHSAT